jgi:CspA family cold shock protein
MKAKVKWFNDAKGYGFIENNEMEDVFVHYSQIKQDGYKSLATGDLVQFDLITTDKGYQAQNVNLINNSITIV